MNKHWQFINRHGDDDKTWWRFRYSPKQSDWTPTGVMIETNGGGYDESERTFNILSVRLRGRTLQLILPGLLAPYFRARAYEDSDGNRVMYSDVFKCEYGFRISDGAVHVHYGRQVHEWPGDKSKVYFFPWRETTHIRHSLYDEAGDLFADVPEWPVRLSGMRVYRYEVKRALEAACPVRLFLFAEDDGDMRVAVCRIEEREWRRGPRKGLWRWLLAWRPNMIRRTLTIEYSDEVGRRKGSWKGGTIGCGIDMLKGEIPYEAFRRHCREEKLHFIGDVTKPAEAARDLRDDAKRFMEEIASGMTRAFEDVRSKIYGAGLVPIYDTTAGKTRAYPARSVNATQHGIILPNGDDAEHIHVPFEPGTVAAMMADGQVEGQWGSDRVVTDAQFQAMVQSAAADGTVNAAMHEEFEARGLDTAFIPARPHAEQEEMAERIRTVQQADTKSTAGRMSIKKSHRGEGENFID